MKSLGIDPGMRGGYALLDNGKVVVAEGWANKTIPEHWDAIAACRGNDVFCLIEKVGASPQMGTSSAFKFGASFGLVQGLVTASQIPWDYIAPCKWQREFGLIQAGRKLGQQDSEKKRLNRQKAAILFPEIRVTHAIADALLIAEYAWRSRSWMEAMSS